MFTVLVDQSLRYEGLPREQDLVRSWWFFPSVMIRPGQGHLAMVSPGWECSDWRLSREHNNMQRIPL